jgi:hypothetical protein
MTPDGICPDEMSIELGQSFGSDLTADNRFDHAVVGLKG